MVLPVQTGVLLDMLGAAQVAAWMVVLVVPGIGQP